MSGPKLSGRKLSMSATQAMPELPQCLGCSRRSIRDQNRTTSVPAMRPSDGWIRDRLARPASVCDLPAVLRDEWRWLGEIIHHGFIHRGCLETTCHAIFGESTCDALVGCRHADRGRNRMCRSGPRSKVARAANRTERNGRTIVDRDVSGTPDRQILVGRQVRFRSQFGPTSPNDRAFRLAAGCAADRALATARPHPTRLFDRR